MRKAGAILLEGKSYPDEPYGSGCQASQKAVEGRRYRLFWRRNRVGVATALVSWCPEGALSASSMLAAKGRVRYAFRRVETFDEGQGKGRVVVRPDTSRVRGHRDPMSGVSVVSARLAAARRASAAEAHASQLDLALAGLAQQLAAARCEISTLSHENAELRASVDRCGVMTTDSGSPGPRHP
jgi:hypothetical protein